ncbi:MAG: winged helix-turn-helix transcriptional regulator [Bdellovibrionaceae bacterium]|nr:winged helix-turn-helix transcriptional regulator [Pseudobdellovibrionaceae bacterium]
MASVSVDKIEKSCVEVSQILKALAHPQRLILLSNLLEGPKTVGELVNLCQASQSQISHFLTRMKLEGLVKAEREGRFVLYSVADKRLVRLMKVIQTEYCEHE